MNSKPVKTYHPPKFSSKSVDLLTERARLAGFKLTCAFAHFTRDNGDVFKNNILSYWLADAHGQTIEFFGSRHVECFLDGVEYQVARAKVTA